MFYTTPDKSVLDSRDRVILFSVDRFISDISQGDACFICGAQSDTVPFNNEHVLPVWILKRYSLHNRTITIPNQTGIKYGQLTIPCCADCNAAMGITFENPIRECLAGGNQVVNKELEKHGPWRFFCWMSLIFLKTHLKDRALQFHRDLRKGGTKIGEIHSWEDLHHVHCLARSYYTGCELTPEVFGSFLVLPAKVRPHLENFDYCDLSFAQTMLLRMDDTAIIAVFNDSQRALSLYREQLDIIDGPLSPLQLREIAVRLACINIHLAERPRFFSDLDLLSEEYKIRCQRPDGLRLETWNDEIQGKIMHHACKDWVADQPEREQLLEDLKTGRWTFLVDDRGEFIRNSMELAPDTP